MTKTKQCRACKAELPDNEYYFYARKAKSGVIIGTSYDCRGCTRAKLVEYRKKNYWESKLAAHTSHTRRSKNKLTYLTVDEFRKLKTDPCHYCGKEGGSIDRKDNDEHYTVENCVPCCLSCNGKKMDMPYETTMEMIEDGSFFERHLGPSKDHV